MGVSQVGRLGLCNTFKTSVSSRLRDFKTSRLLYNPSEGSFTEFLLKHRGLKCIIYTEISENLKILSKKCNFKGAAFM